METHSAVSLRDILSYNFISQLRFSPKHGPAAFRVHSPRYEDNRYAVDLWILQTDESPAAEAGRAARHAAPVGGEADAAAPGAANAGSGLPRRLTSCGRVSVYAWEDDTHIVFASDRDPEDQKKREEGTPFTQFYRISTAGGEAVPHFRTDFAVSDIRMLADGRMVLQGTLDHVAEEERKARKDASVTRINEVPMWSNGGGFTSDTRGALFLRSSDGSITRLTPDYCGVEDFAVAADASVILFTGLEYRGKREARNDLYRVDLTGFDPTSTAPGQAPRTKLSDDLPRQYGRPVFMDGNRALLSVNRMERYGLNENPDLALLDLSAGTLRFVTEGMDRSLGNSVNSDCRFAAGSPPRFHKGRLVFVSTEGETSGLRSFDPESGAIRDLYVPQGSIDAFDLRGEQALVVELRPDALQELYQLPIETDAEAEAERPAAAAAAGPVRLSSFNVANLVSKRFRTPEPLSVSREDGTEITGYVLSPPETASASSASGRRPGILAIHGGPKTAYGSVFNHEMQVLAAEGYYVFFCNPRGSDGRGNAFADIRGRYGTVDYEDLMAFTDAVLQRYVDRIDDTRLGVMGGSYGGFMTNWIVGNTERFAAGVSQRSISSWLSMWGTSDIGFFFTEDQIAGDPWEGREALWRQSPLRLAPQVKTPVLLIHSRQDYRCWEVEAFQFFTAIRYHGGEAAIALFDGENHELSRSGKPKPRIRRLQEILDWFKVYLA